MGRLLICADENFPGQAVHLLREDGHDVLWMAEQGPKTADVDVLALADAEGRLLVTFDKDFGELAVRRRLRATSGIVLFRIKVIDPEETARRLVRILESGVRWQGHFSVVTDRLTRQRPLSG
jgi:predicted nuclease of predicted toxin-antitoxin system